MTLILRSDSFEENGIIPEEFTCHGKNISPALKWEGVPTHTKSFTIICEDPDAPGGTWIHWVVYNIPEHTTSLSQNLESKKIFDNGTKQGTNDFGKIGYGGPCPPHGIHRYFFKLYALDSGLNLEPGANSHEVMAVMQNHILEKTELIGKYGKR